MIGYSLTNPKLLRAPGEPVRRNPCKVLKVKSLFKRSVQIVAALCLTLAATLSSPLQSGAQELNGEGLPVETLVVTTRNGQHEFQVEVASTDVQRAKGLMHREEMAESAGMLFVFEASGDRYFWMKNTPLSLDIIFISDGGRIVRIAEDTVPFSEKIIPSRLPAKYVLELNAGTSMKLGISEGDLVSAPSMSNQ